MHDKPRKRKKEKTFLIPCEMGEMLEGAVVGNRDVFWAQRTDIELLNGRDGVQNGFLAWMLSKLT